MTIRPGEPWGHPGAVPAGAPIVDDDAGVAALVEAWAADGRPDGGVVVGLRGGDLHRTIGAPPASRLTTPDAMWLPCDVGRVVIDGRERWFVAHLVAGDGPWFRGRTAVVMNAAFVGRANLGPRAHPGDGRLDVTAGRLGWRARHQAQQRYGSGSHLPHPALSTSRSATARLDFDRPVTVRLDGVVAGRADELDIELVADVLTVVA